MSSGIIARAREPDLPTLVGLCGRYHEFESIASTEATRERTLRPLLRNDVYGAIFIGREARIPTGYVAICFGYSIELGGREAFIDELFVEKEWRGRGIGNDLLGAAIHFSTNAGAAALHIEVAHDNARAKAFYTDHGFGPRNQYFLMTRSLAG